MTRSPTKLATVLLAVLVAWTSSCTEAVRVEPTDYEKADINATYRITTTDNRVFTAKRLKIGDELVSFTCNKQRVEIPAKDILLVERLDLDPSNTLVVAIAITVAAAWWLELALEVFLGWAMGD